MIKFLDKSKLNIVLAMLLLAVGWIALHPFFKYYLDADSVAYLTIAQRYVAGDYSRAINGMWSPLNIWLIIPLLKQGIEPLAAAQWINLCIALLIIPSYYLLMERMKLTALSRLVNLIILIPLLIYFSYFQVFADLLSVLIWIWILDLSLAHNFSKSYWKIAIVCLLGSLSYLAKSYNFYFFPLYIIGYFFVCREKIQWKNKSLFKVIYSLLIFFIGCAPWIYQLYMKYGFFTSSVAGKLNMTWYLVNKREYASQYKALVPPTYQDSPSFWEDPSFVQGVIHSPFESLKLFVMKIGRIGYAINETMVGIQQISGLLIVVLMFGVVILLTSKYAHHKRLKVLAFVTLTLPLGYMMVHCESRYLWLMTFTGLLLLFWGLEKLQVFHHRKILRLVVYFIVALSFWAYPMVDMEQLVYKGKDNTEIADYLKKENLTHLNFTSNIIGGEAWKIAYLSENHFYEPLFFEDFDYDTLLKELDTHHITLFLYFTSEDKGKYDTYISVFEKIGFGELMNTGLPNVRVFIRSIY